MKLLTLPFVCFNYEFLLFTDEIREIVHFYKPGRHTRRMPAN